MAPKAKAGQKGAANMGMFFYIKMRDLCQRWKLAKKEATDKAIGVWDTAVLRRTTFSEDKKQVT